MVKHKREAKRYAGVPEPSDGEDQHILDEFTLATVVQTGEGIPPQADFFLEPSLDRNCDGCGAR
jgi:hypothetical protein